MSGARFWDHGYTVAERLLDPGQIAFARAAMDASERAGRMRESRSKAVPGTAYNEYSPIAGEVLLRACRPAIESIVERELLPAYAFGRVYRRGAALLRHVDRNACEISATVSIGGEPEGQLWPIMVEALDGQAAGIPLAPGNAAIYQGCKVPHWREPLEGAIQYQLFLHYVLKDGPNAALAFDGRARLEFVDG